MSTQVQYRRGTTAENDAFTGALAEITVDTTAGSLRVHNGVSAGGSKMATESYVTTAIGALSANSITNGTSSVAVIASGGNIRANVGGSTISTIYSGGIEVTGLVSVTGNVTGGNIITSNIVNSGANGVGNIGTATTYFNTVFAKATSAQYADVAELYAADANYTIGTVLVFGGNNEVTMSTQSHDPRIAGTVSESPAFVMNSGLKHDCKTEVALLGRVPCRVVGTDIKKGDRLVASNVPGVATKMTAELYQPGCIIGKALEDYNSTEVGIIEIVVGRL